MSRHLPFALLALAAVAVATPVAEAGPGRVTVTRAVIVTSEWDATQPGYPAKGPPVERVLSRKNYPGFDALMKRVLDRTLVNDEVTLRAYVALGLAGDRAELARIDALGPPDPGQPSGSGTSTSFVLYDGSRRIFEFPASFDAYSGGWVRRLHQLTADPRSRALADPSALGRLRGALAVREAAADYLEALDERLARAPGKGGGCAALVADGLDPIERLDVELDELAAIPALRRTAVALARAAVALDRARRALRRRCTATPGAPDAALLAAVTAARPRFAAALAAFDATVDAHFRAQVGGCREPRGTFRAGTCPLLLAAYDAVEAYEAGADLAAPNAALESIRAALAARAATPAERAVVERARVLGADLARRAGHPRGYRFYRFYFRGLLEDVGALSTR